MKSTLPVFNYARLAIATGLMLLASGCETAQKFSLTYKLWTSDRLRQFCEPADPANLRLYCSPTAPDDVLVEYDAFSESSDQAQRRAYFLHPNLARIAARQKPVFINPKSSRSLQPLTLLEASAVQTNNAHQMAFAAIKFNAGQAFVLYCQGKPQQTNELPVYCESAHTGARVLLTPLAVAGDTVMVGVVASIVGFVLWAQVGAPGTLHH